MKTSLLFAVVVALVGCGGYDAGSSSLPDGDSSLSPDAGVGGGGHGEGPAPLPDGGSSSLPDGDVGGGGHGEGPAPLPDGDSSPLTGPVVDLSTSEQQVLCEGFVATLCSKPGFASFCNACVTSNGCWMAATTGTIESICIAPNTVEMVDECAASGEYDDCVQGGGCMIDALEDVCH